MGHQATGGTAEIEQARAIRRRVRLASGRPDGRCGKVSEAIAAELRWTYRWGHLRLLDGGVCWIHCWNQRPDGTIVDTTSDQFEELWLGEVVVLPPSHPRQTSYRPAPRGHLFRTLLTGGQRRLLAGSAQPDGAFGPEEAELASVADTPEGWVALGASAVHIHSGWQLPGWIAEEAGARLREAGVAGQALPSRELEFVLDAAAQQRRTATHGQWTSPEWHEAQGAGRRITDEEGSPAGYP